MTLLACGINYKTAPIALREKFIFAPDNLENDLNDLLSEGAVSGAVLLSTCHRSEIYCETSDVNRVVTWISKQYQITPDILFSALYCYTDQQAVAHMMRVACGLDSLIVGETEILCQMKTAFSEACAAGAVEMTLQRLFQTIFSVAKSVRTHTQVGACPVSIASAAVKFLKEKIKNFTNSRILLIGAGETIDLTLKHLKKYGASLITITNRQLEKAQEKAAQYDLTVCDFVEMPALFSQMDIVISATKSPVPIVLKDFIFSAMTQRVYPLYLMDLAVPRDIEASISTIENVFLYTIDDLKKIIQGNLTHRQHAAEKAEEMIAVESAAFMRWLCSLRAVNTIRTYRRHIENLRDRELKKSLHLLASGAASEEVVTQLAHALTNKFLHEPSVQLREASGEGRFDILELAHELFNIKKVKVEC